MADYIKRIQSRLSRKNIKQTRPVLIDAVAELGFDHNKLTDVEVDNLTNLLVEKYSTEIVHQVNETDTENSPQTLPDQSLMHEEKKAEIVISSEQKEELITTQASVLGIELSEVEVVELAARVGDTFSDYAEFIKETALTIKAYANHRYDSLEQQLSEVSTDLKNHLQYREVQLNQKLSTELGEINNFFRGKSQERKELSKAIAAAFKF